MKITNFRGDHGNMSAKKETLDLSEKSGKLYSLHRSWTACQVEAGQISFQCMSFMGKRISEAFVAEILVRSPRKRFFLIKKCVFRIKYPRKQTFTQRPRLGGQFRPSISVRLMKFRPNFQLSHRNGLKIVRMPKNLFDVTPPYCDLILKKTSLMRISDIVLSDVSVRPPCN